MSYFRPRLAPRPVKSQARRVFTGNSYFYLHGTIAGSEAADDNRTLQKVTPAGTDCETNRVSQHCLVLHCSENISKKS